VEEMVVDRKPTEDAFLKGSGKSILYITTLQHGNPFVNVDYAPHSLTAPYAASQFIR
jgi:hypothetical protein